MILVDTAILVYAVGAEHPLRRPALELLRLGHEGVVQLTTTVEVVQEFLHVRAQRRPRPDAVALARSYARALAPLLRPDEADLQTALDLFGSVKTLGAFDAVLAAAAQTRGRAVASADRAFGQVAGLKFLDPSSPTFLAGARAIG